MDFLKEFFEAEGTDKNFEAFGKWIKEKGFKLADLSKGEYEAKAKVERQLKEMEEKLSAEFTAKEATLKEELAKKEAEFAEKEKQTTSTLTEGEKLSKELRAELEKLTKKHETTMKDVEKLRLESDEAKKQSVIAERRALYIEAGGKQKNVQRDVNYLSAQVTNDLSFEAVLETYKKENPDVFTSEQTKVSTLPDLKGGNKEAEDKELAAARRGAGLPPEKP